jgi:hypothetical protein
MKGLVLAAMLVLGGGGVSLAAPQELRFDVVGQPVKAAHDAVLVVHVSPVTKLNITSQKLHMVMGKVDAPAKITPLPPDASGDYRFNADLTMYGEWTLDLAASVAEEPTPVTASITFQVVK